MIKVFVSGSINIHILPQLAIEKLDSIMDKNFLVLIGDAPGVDSLVQQYLLSKNYRNVLVYYAGGTVRNNKGAWNIVHVESNNLIGRAMYTLKDKKMAKDSDYGLMIWDGKSKGTKENINEMLSLNKKFYVVENNFLKTHKDIKQNEL